MAAQAARHVASEPAPDEAACPVCDGRLKPFRHPWLRRCEGCGTLRGLLEIAIPDTPTEALIDAQRVERLPGDGDWVFPGADGKRRGLDLSTWVLVRRRAGLRTVGIGAKSSVGVGCDGSARSSADGHQSLSGRFCYSRAIDGGLHQLFGGHLP